MSNIWQSCKLCKKAIDTRPLIPFIDKDGDTKLKYWVCDDCRPLYEKFLDNSFLDSLFSGDCANCGGYMVYGHNFVRCGMCGGSRRKGNRFTK